MLEGLPGTPEPRKEMVEMRLADRTAAPVELVSGGETARRRGPSRCHGAQRRRFPLGEGTQNDLSGRRRAASGGGGC